MPFKDEVGGNGIEIPRIQINMSDNKKDTVEKVVLSLRMLGSFGDSSGTPFVRDVNGRQL